MARIRHIAICTADPEREARFYCEAFGLTETRRGEDFIGLFDGYLGVTLIKVDPGSPRRGLDHFGIHVESLEATLERLRRVEPAVEIRKPDRAGTTSEYKVWDPDGNVFDISESGWR
jgi:catechol 2,3-dioxygenase-like lactoylglutathione lyase family enzyme